MTTTNPTPSNGETPCSNRVRAFRAYGIDDGTDLVHRVRYRHLDRDVEFEPTGPFFDGLDRAFRSAFVQTAETSVVPEPVSFAIEDAITAASGEFKAPDVDLRYELLPAVYRMIADRFCRYAQSYSGDGVGFVFEDDDDGGHPATIGGQ